MQPSTDDPGELLRDLLDHIERDQRAILEALNCPTDILAVQEIISGQRPAPWLEKDARRDELRATYATFALTFVNKTRLFLDPSAPVPAMAAYNALFAGAYASDTVLNAAKQLAVREGSRRGQETRRATAPARAAEYDHAIFDLEERYRGDPANRKHSKSAMLAWIAFQLKIEQGVIKTPKTIERRLNTKSK